MSEQIHTRCPSCLNTTLVVDDSKNLVCSWIECKDPTLINRIINEAVEREDRERRFTGIDRLTVTIYAILALYEHGHITEGKASELMQCSNIVDFRLMREHSFEEMCQILNLPPTPAPLPLP